MRAILVPMDGSTPIEITRDLILVGRKESCDLKIDHKSISKLHCIIVKTDGLLLIRDLGSTNGTRVNGQRVRRAALLPNDLLNIASLRYKVEFTNEQDSPADANEFTQQMDDMEVQKLLSRHVEDLEDAVDAEGAANIDLPPIQTNVLPDVYEDKQEKEKGK